MKQMADHQIRRYLKSRVLMIRFFSITTMLKITSHVELGHPKMEQILALAGNK